MEIQDRRSHSSEEDAMTAMALFRAYAENLLESAKLDIKGRQVLFVTEQF